MDQLPQEVICCILDFVQLTVTDNAHRVMDNGTHTASNSWEISIANRRYGSSRKMSSILFGYLKNYAVHKERDGTRRLFFVFPHIAIVMRSFHFSYVTIANRCDRNDAVVQCQRILMQNLFRGCFRNCKSLSLSCMFYGDLLDQVIEQCAYELAVTPVKGDCSISCGPQLESLALLQCELKSSGAYETLAKMVRQSTTLKRLRVLFNSVGKASNALLAAVEENRSIRAFAIQGLDDMHAYRLRSLLEHNTTLESLDLRENFLSRASAKQIAAGLHRNKSLRRLDLGMNFIGDEGAASLADMLKRNTILQELRLEMDNIGSAGCAMIFHSLAENNRSLQVLNLGDNRIDNKASKSIRECLQRQDCSILELDLHLNDLGDAGVRYISEGLCENRSLRVLDLSANGVSSRGLHYLSRAVCVGATGLREILIHNNKLDASGLHSLACAVQQREYFGNGRLMAFPATPATGYPSRYPRIPRTTHPVETKWLRGVRKKPTVTSLALRRITALRSSRRPCSTYSPSSVLTPIENPGRYQQGMRCKKLSMILNTQTVLI